MELSDNVTLCIVRQGRTTCWRGHMDYAKWIGCTFNQVRQRSHESLEINAN